MQRIPLSGKKGKGMYALVDDEDYPVLSRVKWFFMLGYAFCRQCKNMHSLVMGYPYANHLHFVDHINGDRLNNQKSNLRLATKQQSTYNRRKCNWKRPPSSKYKGVSLYYVTAAGERLWMATIAKTDNGVQKQKQIRSFTTEKAAALAYDGMARKLYGEFAVLNFPDH